MDVLEPILSASPGPVVITDRRGEIVDCNHHVKPVLGYCASDLRGKTVETLIEPADPEMGENFPQAYLTDPEPCPRGIDLDLVARHADGEPIPVQICLGPIEVNDETHVVASIIDVSDREACVPADTESETRYRRLLDVSPAPIVIYDADGVIRYANEAAANLVALDDSRAVVGRPTSDFVHPSDHEASRKAVQRVLREGERIESVERRIVAADGETRDVILSTVPISFDGEPAGQVLLSDVTPLKERERALERQNDRLEDFAGIVSHDLRNPLTVLETSLDLARETGDAEHFDRAGRAVNRMETLIDDLLTMARYGRTPESLERIPLDRAAREAWQTVETGDATLTVEAADGVRAEANRLQELLENLFRNAIEHGGSGVTISVTDTDEGFAVFDDGPGIPPADRDRVFERGYTTNDDGTGYGLAIVADLTEAHGWDISVEESEEGGARFAFETG